MTCRGRVVGDLGSGAARHAAHLAARHEPAQVVAVAQPDVVSIDVPAKTPEGGATTMRRWVLQEHVWAKVLDEAGFTRITVDVLPSTVSGPRTADTLLVTGVRQL
ncbi:hypothetical protein [Streptomyces sp. NPDC102264]|uniref:hypothetical protein n=1 Tax=Streptomyces sp. NPDC102264 TaxID=3366149 RepID=UPI0037F1B0B7